MKEAVRCALLCLPIDDLEVQGADAGTWSLLELQLLELGQPRILRGATAGGVDFVGKSQHGRGSGRHLPI